MSLIARTNRIHARSSPIARNVCGTFRFGDFRPALTSHGAGRIADGGARHLCNSMCCSSDQCSCLNEFVTGKIGSLPRGFEGQNRQICGCPYLPFAIDKGQVKAMHWMGSSPIPDPPSKEEQVQAQMQSDLDRLAEWNRIYGLRGGDEGK